MKNYIVLLSCYGLVDESRSEAELRGIHSYLESTSNYLKSLDTTPKAVVFCGGRTNTSVGFDSEAESMVRYSIDKGFFGDLPLLVETTSHTAYEGLAFGLAHIRNLLDSSTVVLCICDSHRFEKISIEANLLFGDYFDVEVQAFDREDIHPNSTREFQLFSSLPSDIKSPEFEHLKSYLESMIATLNYSS